MADPRHLVGRRKVILTGCGALATLLAACGANSGAQETGVDLTYTKSGRLTGTFAGRRVDLSSKLPSGTGTLSGTVAGEPADANWHIAYNAQQVKPSCL